MATAGANPVDYELVRVGILKLEDARYKFPEYTGVSILSADLLIVVESNAFTLRLHSCHSGQLLATSDRLQAQPHDVCMANRKGNEVAVTLRNGKIEILLVESTNQSVTIRWVRTLDLTKGFEYCHGVGALRSGNKLVVSGGKEDNDAQGDWICWSLVSYLDGHVGTVHKICKSGGASYGSTSYLATSIDDSTIYISCWTGPYYPKNNGVYAYDIMTGRLKFIYRNRDLTNPKGLSVDKMGFIYVCNWDPTCIHQLTEKMEPVTIHRKGMPPEPMAIDWEEKREDLYVTRMRNKEVWRLHPQWSDQQAFSLVTTTTPQSIMPQNASAQQLHHILQHSNLLQYFESFIAKGGDDVRQLHDAGEEEFQEIMELVGMKSKPLHVKRFKKALQEWHLNSRPLQDLSVHLDDSLAVLSNLGRSGPSSSVIEKDYPLEISMEGKRVMPEEQMLEHCADGSLQGLPVLVDDSLRELSNLESSRCTSSMISIEKDDPLEISAKGNRVMPEEQMLEHCADGVPIEILKMDDRSIQLFKEALRDGKEKVYNIRVMVVGHLGVGKTTLIKRLLGQEVNIFERHSTEGIDIYVNCCDVSLSTGEWTRQEKDLEQEYWLQRLARVLKKQHSMKDKMDDSKQACIIPHGETDSYASVADKERVIIPSKGERTYSKHEEAVVAIVGDNKEILYSRSSRQEFSQNLSSTASQQEDSPFTLVQRNLTQSETSTMAMLKLLQANAYKLRDTGRKSPLTIWDFAGQYAFYTTHQTFLTRRAIYLLVTDVSEQLTDLVADECFSDSEGIMKCKVYELVDVWLNSIHSCAQSSEASSPPVILVGTHVDQLLWAQHKTSRDEVCMRYFIGIRTHLSNKHTRYHLVDEDFAIDNTVVDRNLEDLKRKIVEVASQQPYWGEEIPARWLLLEQALMRLRAAGVKVIPWNMMEELNQTGAVQISTDELDLFLRFQHDIGTVIYFSIYSLRGKIVLDPKWLIDALKSLITAEIFILRNTPAVADKWFEFKMKGKLSRELIDAIWTKEMNQDLHDNKEHILLLMEQLNIIAKLRSYGDDGNIQEEDYYLAPCMLRQQMPREVISPESDPEVENGSFLCFMCTGKFLPVPVFHRLLGACLTHWPIAKKRFENLIYCGCCIFDLDHQHRLTMHLKDYVIFVQVRRMRVKDMNHSSMLCSEARKFIAENLSKIIGNLGQSLQFEMYIQCPDSDAGNLEGLIPVSLLKENEKVVCHYHDKSHTLVSRELLKFWFQEEAKQDSHKHQQGMEWRQSPCSEEDQEQGALDDYDAPITQEHINHARLSNAMTTVCANALRQILLISVPAPHTDIYQAILANKAKLKRLNKDQYQLVFPDPQGIYTGTVEEFDISLLYTIIRNVSSVPAPSNGWGNPPSDRPRDISLGASVERIRFYRNLISSHSVDGRISQQEFDNYWNQIDDLLLDVENAIGNHGYLEDLEKRKYQVITPDEARQLRKAFHEYKRSVEAAAADIRSVLENALSAVKSLSDHKN